jgi:hypothetical protein
MTAAAPPTQAYCVKCKAKQAMKDAKLVVAKGRARYAGKCDKCNTSVSVFTKVPENAK